MRYIASVAVNLALLGSFSEALAADLAVPPPPAEIMQPFQFILSNDFRYYSFSGNRAYVNNIIVPKGRGSQFYSPTSLEAIGNITSELTLDSVIRSGYVYSNQATPSYSGSVSTATDTSITNTVTYLGFGNIQPFLSLALNIPTGTSGLFGKSSRARLDSDLVELGTFGEGFNVGPSIGVNIALTNELVASLAAGYTHRGDYNSDLESVEILNPPSPGNRFSPGDLFSFSPTLAYQSGPLTLVGAGSLAFEGDTLNNGVKDYRTGYQALVSISGNYRWSELWLTSFSGSYQHIGPNKSNNSVIDNVVQSGTGVYQLQPFDINSDRFRIDLEHDYTIGKLSIGPTAGFLYRDRNTYDPNTLEFVPAKTQWKVGGRAVYAVNDSLTVTLRGDHGWTHESYKASEIVVDPLSGALTDPSSVGPINDRSWQVALGTVYKF